MVTIYYLPLNSSGAQAIANAVQLSAINEKNGVH